MNDAHSQFAYTGIGINFSELALKFERLKSILTSEFRKSQRFSCLYDKSGGYVAI